MILCIKSFWAIILVLLILIKIKDQKLCQLDPGSPKYGAFEGVEIREIWGIREPYRIRIRPIYHAKAQHNRHHHHHEHLRSLKPLHRSRCFNSSTVFWDLEGLVFNPQNRPIWLYFFRVFHSHWGEFRFGISLATSMNVPIRCPKCLFYLKEAAFALSWSLVKGVVPLSLYTCVWARELSSSSVQLIQWKWEVKMGKNEIKKKPIH